MQLTLPTHCGTHLDAPSHFIQDGGTLDAVAVQSLIGPALCVEVNVPANNAITPHDLRAAGELAPGTALLIRTGWDALYGADGYMHHPYLSAEAAEWIVAAKARLVGIDVVTPELPGHLRPPGYPCPVHMTLLGAGVLILENLDLRPVTGSACNLFVGVLRVSGAALRATARAQGRAIGEVDALIASIARATGFTVATRDTAPFAAGGITVVNPFDQTR